MSKIIVNGGKKLCGEVAVGGAKNAVLPIMAAALAAGGECVIHNCPKLSDVSAAAEILRSVGASAERDGDTLVIDSSGAANYSIPEQLMRKMRSSVIFCGALAGVFGAAEVSHPGGCEIGARPVDLHIAAFRKMGIIVEEKCGRIICRGKPKGAKIRLALPSVGATENIMLAAVTADGETVIENAAREPEICDLAMFLNSMGARILGFGEPVIRIEGVQKLCGTEYTVMPDRIVAATYMAAAAAAGGDALLLGAEYPSVRAVAEALESGGCEIRETDGGLRVSQPRRMGAVRHVSTAPYPMFPTDAQAVLTAAVLKADGVSVIEENMFENRWRHVPELCKMGAKIEVCGNKAEIFGTEKLHGAKVSCTDLRGGAALCVAALSAEGASEIDKLCHIDRGYEDIAGDLAALGADIKREDD